LRIKNAKIVSAKETIKPGDIYGDTFYHPYPCIAVGNGEITGISLVYGTYPPAADIGVSRVGKFSPEEARTKTFLD
jgi:hypothetical protein